MILSQNLTVNYNLKERLVNSEGVTNLFADMSTKYLLFYLKDSEQFEAKI